MNVSELIEQLQKLDPSLEVYVTGYEGGYDDVEKMEHIEVCKNFYYDEWYYGNHEEFNAVRKGPADPFTFDIARGIVLTR
jgi:hypothetical protein